MEAVVEQSFDEKASKVIQIPIFERVELRRCENPWVKPRLMEKNLSENERKMKVSLFFFLLNITNNYFFSEDNIVSFDVNFF